MNTLTIENELVKFTATAKAIAWDTCHKIYVLMDDDQVSKMIGYGYGDTMITSDRMTPEQLTDQVMEWYEDSCGLRFISAVSAGDSFADIAPQFWGQEDN
jgi:hypothetical protein